MPMTSTLQLAVPARFADKLAKWFYKKPIELKL